MQINELKEKMSGTAFKGLQVLEKDWNEIGGLNFTGVYILCDSKSDEIVYVGSAYSKKRGLRKRLRNHISKAGASSLKRHIAQQIGDVESAMAFIKGLRLFVIQYQDLEQMLIEMSNPKFNTIHKTE